MFSGVFSFEKLKLLIWPKIWQGSISRGSEVQLEVAEILWRNVKVIECLLVLCKIQIGSLKVFNLFLQIQLEGSLLVLAENIVGSFKENSNAENILHYGDR